MAPLIWLLLGGVGLALVASSPSSKKAPKRAALKPLSDRIDPGKLEGIAARFPSGDAEAIVKTYGQGSSEDFPVPYDYANAERIAFWLSARMHPQIEIDPYIALVKKRFSSVRGSSLSKRKKTIALIWGVIVPALGYATLWRWVHGSDLEHGVRQKQLVAVTTWLGMWALGPETSTVSYWGAGFHAEVPVSLETASSASVAPLSTAPNAAARRDVLLAILTRIRELGCETFPGSAFYCEQIRIGGAERVEQIATEYAEVSRYEQGNILLVAELVRVVMMNNTSFFRINLPSKEEGIFRLVLNIVAVVLAAVAPYLAAAIASAGAAIGGAVEAIAAAIGVPATQAATMGAYAVYAVQAALGASVAWVLQESGVYQQIAHGTAIAEAIESYENEH